MSLLKIANKALRKLAVTELISLTQSGKAAARCNAAVEDIVKELLRDHPFGFATVWDSLALLVESPPFGYEYAYQLPTAAIRVKDIRAETDLKAPTIDYELTRGNIIYTDASPCYIRYVVYAASDLAKAPPDFIEAAAYKLATEIAIPLAKSDLVPMMRSGYMYAMDIAKLNDAATENEREEDENRNNTILTAMEYPGYTGDHPYEEV